MRQHFLAALALVISATACGSSGGSYATSPSTTPIPAGPTTVLVPSGTAYGNGSNFTPKTLTVPVGTTVTWGNNDSIDHTTTADAGQWNSNHIMPGATFTFKFDATGTYTYHCAIHSSETGTIVVQ